MSRSIVIVTFLCFLCVVAGCATSHNATSRPEAIPAAPDTGPRIASAALDLIGIPYRYGGSDKNGFDCSGLVQYAHALAGISIPRTTAAQFNAANRTPGDIQVGDVLFFKINGRISHNGVYLGGGRFIHAPSTGKNVSIARTENPYFRKRLAGVRRFR